jgi:hypothetical protein
MRMDDRGRIPSALELTTDELLALRAILARSFIPANQIDREVRLHLLQLGLICKALGGLMATPAGRIVARF